MCHLWCLCGVVQLVSWFFWKLFPWLESLGSLVGATCSDQSPFWSLSNVPNIPRSVRLNRSIWPFPCGWYGVLLVSRYLPPWTNKSLVILDSKSRPWSECNRWGKPKSPRIFFHNNVTPVETCWFRVGNAHEYLVRLSVTTRTCWFLFSNDIDKKSIANSFIGSLIRLGTIHALGGSRDFLSTQRSQFSLRFSTSFAMLGRQNRRPIRSKVLSRPRWPISLWKPGRTRLLLALGRCCSASTTRCLYRKPSRNTRRSCSPEIHDSSGLCVWTSSRDCFRSRRTRIQPIVVSTFWSCH